MARKQMPDAVKIALISGVVSIITALITASVQWQAAEKQEKVEVQKEADQAENEVLPAAKAKGAVLETLSAGVSYNKDGKPKTNRDPEKGWVKADICVLTTVSSYGGASKACTLAQNEEGWALTATGRKATSTCRAICFDLPPEPSGG